MKRLFAALVVALAAGCGGDPKIQESDWERQNAARLQKEAVRSLQVELPPFPRQENLLEFTIGTASEFRFFIDRASLGVGKEGIVRYILVARSPGGSENISYEGMNCLSYEIQVYAIGRADGSWVAGAAHWRSLAEPGAQRWHRVLSREFFCPAKRPIASSAEGVTALERGIHPSLAPR